MGIVIGQQGALHGAVLGKTILFDDANNWLAGTTFNDTGYYTTSGICLHQIQADGSLIVNGYAIVKITNNENSHISGYAPMFALDASITKSYEMDPNQVIIPNMSYGPLPRIYVTGSTIPGQLTYGKIGIANGKLGISPAYGSWTVGSFMVFFPNVKMLTSA